MTGRQIAPLVAALLSPATAIAQTAPAPTVQAVASPSSVATDIAAKLFPDGTYRRMLGPVMSRMVGSMTDSASTMPIAPVLRAAGLPEKDIGTLDKATIGQVMAILDPAYKVRMSRMLDRLFTAMIPIFEKLEPDLRAGLALSLEARFTPAQLHDLQGFFATPTGSSYASQQMTLFMDPAVMGRMQAAMPKVMEALPAVLGQVAKANDDLPKAKTYDQLTPEERERLAALLGIDTKKLKQ